MEKRLLLALLLAVGVITVTPILFPTGSRKPTPVGAKSDSTARDSLVADTLPASPTTGQQKDTVPSNVSASALQQVPVETVTVSTSKAAFRLSNRGAVPVAVEMQNFLNLARRSGRVRLSSGATPLLRYTVLTPRDTIRLDTVTFRRSSTAEGSMQPLTYETTTAAGEHIVLQYRFASDGYSARVTGSITPAPSGGPSYLLIDLPQGFLPSEADTAEEERHFAYAFKPMNDNARSFQFSSLEPGATTIERGPLTWVAAKTKYFVVGVLAPTAGQPIDEVSMTGQPRVNKVATRASATAVTTLKGNEFSFEIYTGPQEWKRLVALGRDFDHVNPYGWSFLQGVVHPLATIVIRVLLWMHNVLHLNYGWVLVIFGVAVRIVLWPLNQSAMRASMKMQELQPRLSEAQKKYQNNPEKQREEVMRIYQESGTSPFTALSGCLPMLLPMPVLFALFFVFQNTIEFRGVSFFWLADISTKDPYYILPVAMGLSMYLLTWIGTRNAPPNPQAKIMGYTFPVMMTFLLSNLAAGLNLYYTVQNLAALPQQWLIARERKRSSSGGVDSTNQGKTATVKNTRPSPVKS
jgi:YidC/Oxa1 family membrane protein insertase